jgi:hypothetical protein
MAKPTFRDMVTSRTVIASAPIEEEQFRKIISKINKRFDLEIEFPREPYELFRDHIGFVAGRFWDELEAVDRKTVLDRLTELATHLRSVKAQLLPLREGLHETADTEVVSLLIRAIDPAHAGQLPRPREQLEISLRMIEGLEDTCGSALGLLSERPAKRGRPSLGWHTELVSLMIQVAARLGIKVSTAGNRGEDPYATPFTILVFEAERVLPEGAWSSSLAACAKRIESSLKRLQRPLRKNSTKTG